MQRPMPEGPGAISRADDATEICEWWGTDEALRDFAGCRGSPARTSRCASDKPTIRRR
jgi:hypothetical protein